MYLYQGVLTQYTTPPYLLFYIDIRPWFTVTIISRVFVLHSSKFGSTAALSLFIYFFLFKNPDVADI